MDGRVCCVNLPRGVLPVDLTRLIRACCDNYMVVRPTIWEIIRILSTYHGDSEHSYFDTLIKRMERFAYELENEVTLRTHNLVAEKERSQMLLRSIYPK